MNNKINNMLKEFLENNDSLSEEQLNKDLQEFMMKYNTGEIEYEDTILDEAYELLEKAERTKSKKQAIKLAKEAYELCPDCFDALLFQVNLEEDSLKREELLNEGLEFEMDRLEDEKYFSNDNIGCFYGIFETRPYIRGLYMKASCLLADGKVKQARDVCMEILRLNESDNTGARYLLMAIYAYLEEEKELLNLYKKYSEENLEMLFPLFALYYKLGKYDKAKDYLKRINKANPNFIKFFKGTLDEGGYTIDGYYSRGDASEMFMYFNRYTFLIMSLPTIDEFILKFSKKY